jgi:hypothetical protein
MRAEGRAAASHPVPVGALDVAEGEAEMIPRTPQHHRALQDVARNEVDHRSSYYAAPDYVWHSGGVVPPAEQDALQELAAVRLTLEIPAVLDGKPGCVVRLSPIGQQVLSQWDSQIPPASGPTVPVGVQPGAGEAQSEGKR